MTKKELLIKFEKFLSNDFVSNRKGKGKTETNRWVFCWDNDKLNSCFDCACCLDGNIDTYPCGCPCHFRIQQIINFFWKLSLNKDNNG